MHPQTPSAHDDDALRAALLRHATHLLSHAWARAQRDGRVRRVPRDGLIIWPEEVDGFIARHLHATPAQAPPGAPPAQAPPGAPPALSLAAAWRQLEASLLALAQAGSPLARRWLGCIERLALRVIEAQALALLVCASCERDLGRALRLATGDVERLGLSLGALVSILLDEESARELAPGRILASLSPDACALFRRHVLALGEAPGCPQAERIVVVPPETAHLLMGFDGAPTRVTWSADVAPLPPRLASALADDLTRLQRTPPPLHLAVVAGPEAGHLACAAAALSPRCQALVCLPLDALEDLDASPPEHLERAVRLASLLGGAVALSGLDDLAPERQRAWSRAAQDRALDAVDHAWLCRAEPPPHLAIPAAHTLTLPYPDRDTRLALWLRGCADGLLSPAACRQLAGQFLLTDGQIAQACATLTTLARPDDDPDARLARAASLARRAADVGFNRLAAPEPHRVHLDQLIVPPDAALLLQEIISYTHHRDALSAHFAQSIPYGLGVTALFSGPPGTGKTLAAMAIATALDRELFRVDLSQLVSKYIGETEKHLAQIFDVAEHAEVMLLFDEADSLFGKRTEVKSSNDRYANLEVNYLLQRIERFNGVTVLTTNFSAGLDDAFVRRLRFHVRFDAPDAPARLRLWQHLLPPSLPAEPDLDLEDLADVYELSGGHIKEAILRAAAVALDTPCPLSSDLLRASADAEYRKLGKLIPGAGLR